MNGTYVIPASFKNWQKPIFAEGQRAEPILSGLKDITVIEGIKGKDKVVFDHVFNHYYTSLCAFAFHFLKDRDAVEDLVQDFFVSLWINAPDLQIRSSLKAYLFASVKNRCIDFQKHRKVSDKYRNYILSEEKSGEETTEFYFAESELRQAIHASMEKLSPRCREIFEMSRFRGLSNGEISGKLGLSKRTVELQISTSLKILRKILKDYLPFMFIGVLIG